MSKERLEEIKNNITSNEKNTVTLHVADFIWLIAQAERVEELENELKDIKGHDGFFKAGYKRYSKTRDERDLLRQQNKHYREMLNRICDDVDIENVLEVVDEYEASEESE